MLLTFHKGYFSLLPAESVRDLPLVEYLVELQEVKLRKYGISQDRDPCCFQFSIRSTLSLEQPINYLSRYWFHLPASVPELLLLVNCDSLYLLSSLVFRASVYLVTLNFLMDLKELLLFSLLTFLSCFEDRSDNFQALYMLDWKLEDLFSSFLFM